MPAVCPIVSLLFKATIDDPTRFKDSKSAAAHLGLMPRVFQSGEVDRSGRISKCGDRLIRHALFDAANSHLRRSKKWSTLRAWGVKVAQRIGAQGLRRSRAQAGDHHASMWPAPSPRSSFRRQILATQWTGAMRGPAFFAYTDNYLIDVKFGIIMDVEASRAIRQAEVGAAQTMIERTEARFDIKPQRLAADTAYGSGPNLNWPVNDKNIAPRIPVIDKPKTRGWDIQPGRLHVRQGACTSVRPAAPHDDGQVGQRRGDTSVHGQHAPLP